MTLRSLFCSLLFLSTSFADAQEKELLVVGGRKELTHSDQLPINITSERSVVIVYKPLLSKKGFSLKGDWKELVENYQKGFRQIGVDVVYALHYADLNGGPEVSGAFSEVLEKRQIKNLIFIKIDETGFINRLIITSYNGKADLIDNGQPCWVTESGEVKTVLLRLGRQVLRQEVDRSNFLIPEIPEYLDEFRLFSGTRYENYSSRLKSQKLAVIKFDGLPPTTLLGNKSYNEKLEELNNRLASMMERYPFEYELVNYQTDQELYDQGFQFSIMPLTNTNRNVKKMLNYNPSDQETEFVSMIPESENVKVKRIPSEAVVTKYYIKQTIVKDLHVGDNWDADVTWDKALENFLFHLRKSFDISN
ncbi:MAG: hypothetical protein RIC03_07985 [Cyclobacteriaceae bacterium]